MVSTRVLVRSFVGGEVTPVLFSRPDDPYYQNGCEVLRNFIVQPQGPARYRPGFRLVREVKDSSKRVRLFPFRYSVFDTLVIEAGEGYFRFHTDGGTVLLTDVPLTYKANKTFTPSDVNGSTEELTITAHGFSTGDPVQLTSDSGALPMVLAPGVFTTATVIPQLHVLYAYRVDANHIKLATTKALALAATPDINFATVGSGTHRIGYAYTIGDLVSHLGSTWYCRKVPNVPGAPAVVPGGDADYWYQETTSFYEVPNSYTEADLPYITYSQVNDVLSLARRGLPFAELRRVSANRWEFVPVTFAAPLPAPGNLAVSVTRGRRLQPTQLSARTVGTVSGGMLSFEGDHGLGDGMTVYMRDFPGSTPFPAGFYVVQTRGTGAPATEAFFQHLDTGRLVLYVGGVVTALSSARVEVASPTTELTNAYQVTAVDKHGNEGTASAVLVVDNNLGVPGASNLLTWNPVAGAVRYRVYKNEGSLPGLVAETESVSFRDTDLEANVGRTIPRFDNDLVADFPGAVGHFEQRRIVAGTGGFPHDVWATRNGTESDLSYHIPVVADDRLQFQVYARERSTILHVVPTDHLLLLTNTSEIRVTPINSDALVPGQISARPQSYVGSSHVRPQIIDRTILFCAARGGHVYAFDFQATADGFEPARVSWRAAHLFDGKTIEESALQLAPFPILWLVSSDGRLLGMTAVPNERVAAWHHHTTMNGVFESVCCVTEGDEDTLYVATQRTINGVTKRYVERQARYEPEDKRLDSYHVDCGLSFDGVPALSATLDIDNGTTWTVGDVVQVTSSPGVFAATDVGDEIELAAGIRLVITSYTSANVVHARPKAFVPASLRADVSGWRFARREFTVTHLDGATVAVSADGEDQGNFVVVGGKVRLTAPAVPVHIGLPIEAKLVPTPPVIDGMPAAGLHLKKNPAQIVLQVENTGPFKAGVDGDTRALQIPTEGELFTGALPPLTIPGRWDAGQFAIEHDRPTPLTVVGATLTIATGGV